MKILIYGIYFAPDLIGVGKYTGEMADWLANKGHSVRAVVAPPYYPAWKIPDDFYGSVWRPSLWNNVAVYRCPLWMPREPTGVKRVLHLMSFMVSSLPWLFRQIFWRPDVVLVIEPPLFCAPAALIFSRISGAKAWLHVQDFEIDAAFSLGLLRGGFLWRASSLVEGWLMRRYDVVSTISKKMRDRLIYKGVTEDKAVLFPNWVDVPTLSACRCDVMDGGFRDEATNPERASYDYRREWGLAPGDIVALYSGNMGAKQGLEVLAEVARLCFFGSTSQFTDKYLSNSPIKLPKILFIFCGEGTGRSDLMASCNGLSNVRFIDLQPASRLPALLAAADIHLLPQRSDAADLVMPSKLAGMLASARPVVATARLDTELAGVVLKCGLLVPPNDAPAMANAVLSLAADEGLRKRLGTLGYLYATKFMNRDAVLGALEEKLSSLC
jgi:colanic acid biosynthesis glycosyl transferase WcaI